MCPNMLRSLKNAGSIRILLHKTLESIQMGDLIKAIPYFVGAHRCRFPPGLLALSIDRPHGMFEIWIKNLGQLNKTLEPKLKHMFSEKEKLANNDFK